MDTQPPNSPDLNILDLGLFRTLQSTTWDKDIRNIRDIDQKAKDAFEAQDPRTLNDTFLSLQKHMEAAMYVEGGNNFERSYGKRELQTCRGKY